MGLFSMFQRQNPQNTPLEQQPTDESLEKFRKSVGHLRPEQLSKFLARLERNRHRMSLEQIDIVQQRLEELSEGVPTAAHAKALEESRKKLGVLQERVTGTAAAERTTKEHEEKHGGDIAGRLGLGVGATILGWFGLRGIRRHGLVGGPARLLTGGARTTTKVLGEGFDFVRHHPILTGFLAGIGFGFVRTVKERREIEEYVAANSDALIREIEASAKERGIDPVQHAESTGKRIADFIRSAGSSTVDTFVKGLTYVFQGTIDPETGAITLPHSTLRPAFWVAYQAGQRSRFASSRPWRYLQGFRLNPFKTREERMLGIIETAGGQAGDRARHIDYVQKLIQAERDPSKRAALERRLASAFNVQAGPRLQAIVADAQTLHRQNLSTFPSVRSEINGDLLKLEQDVRRGTNIPIGQTIEQYKAGQLTAIDRKVRGHLKDLEQRKMALGNQYAEALNTYAKGRLDAAGGGNIDATRKAMENTGYKFARIPGGRWVVKAAVGYSLLPFGMELASAFTNTLEGNPKLKRLKAKQESGEQLTEAEQKELSRLENQWGAAGRDFAQIAGGFVPVAGEALDFKTAFTGKDLNGRELSTLSRVTSGVMGVLGTASLALAPFTFGGSAVAWRALRGGTAATKALSKGTKSADKSIEALRQSTAFVERARAVGTVSTTQRAAMAARGYVGMARGGMQVFSYSVLGYHLGAGAVDFAQTSAEKISGVKGRAAEYVENIGDEVKSRIPGRRPLPEGQAPEEGGHGEAA